MKPAMAMMQMAKAMKRMPVNLDELEELATALLGLRSLLRPRYIRQMLRHATTRSCTPAVTRPNVAKTAMHSFTLSFFTNYCSWCNVLEIYYLMDIMTVCTSTTARGYRCKRHARAGSKTCSSHSRSRTRKGLKKPASNRSLDDTIHTSLSSLKLLSKASRGEMKRRLESISIDIKSYFLALGPYPEELGLGQ
jgi:hypothetical protein